MTRSRKFHPITRRKSAQKKESQAKIVAHNAAESGSVAGPEGRLPLGRTIGLRAIVARCKIAKSNHWNTWNTRTVWIIITLQYAHQFTRFQLRKGKIATNRYPNCPWNPNRVVWGETYKACTFFAWTLFCQKRVLQREWAVISDVTGVGSLSTQKVKEPKFWNVKLSDPPPELIFSFLIQVQFINLRLPETNKVLYWQWRVYQCVQNPKIECVIDLKQDESN